MISNDRGPDCAGKSQLLSKQQNSRLLQTEAFTDIKTSVTQKLKFVFRK